MTARFGIPQTAWDVALRVCVAFCTGIGVGALILVPFTGALAIAFAMGAFMLGGPLALLGAIIAAFASRSVYRRPIVWSASAGMISVGVYAMTDPPVNLFAVQRCVMALMFAVCCALAFVWLQRDAVRVGGGKNRARVAPGPLRPSD